MLYFAQPVFLWLILLAPLFLLALALKSRLRRRKMKRLGDEALVKSLMPSVSRSKAFFRTVLFLLGLISFAIGLARPQLGAKLSEKRKSGAEVVIALDVSNSMLARDYSPDRLSRAKMAISALVDKLRDDRIGLVIFAGTSFVQLPVTADYVSAKMFLSGISENSVPVQGTAIGDAIQTAIRSFSPQSENSRAIIVITDGENHEDDPVEMAKTAAEMGIKVYTIGVGSASGEPVMLGGQWLKDASGNMVVTKLDENVLKEVAKAGEGAYIHAGNEEFGLNPIIEDIRKLNDEQFSSVVFEEYEEQYMYFFAFALFCFVLEFLVGRRRASFKLFDNQ